MIHLRLISRLFNYNTVQDWTLATTGYTVTTLSLVHENMERLYTTSTGFEIIDRNLEIIIALPLIDPLGSYLPSGYNSDLGDFDSYYTDSQYYRDPLDLYGEDHNYDTESPIYSPTSTLSQLTPCFWYSYYTDSEYYRDPLYLYGEDHNYGTESPIYSPTFYLKTLL